MLEAKIRMSKLKEFCLRHLFTISFAWQQLLEDVGDYQHRVDMLVVLICERIAFFV